MSETANLKIVAPDSNSVLVPLHSHFAALASTVDDAITNRFQVKQLRYETETQRDADYTASTGKPVITTAGKPDLVDGDMCIVNLNKRQFIWNLNGSTGSWLALGKRFVFASISERDAMPAVDIYEGDTCYVRDVDTDFTWDGAAWTEWKSWTPTVAGWTGYTLNYARYRQHGKTVHYEIKITGSTTAPSTFTITPPVTANSTVAEADAIAGTGTLRIGGGGLYQATNVWTSSTTWRPAFISSAAAAISYFSSTVPATYATATIIRLTGTYEAA